MASGTPGKSTAQGGSEEVSNVISIQFWADFYDNLARAEKKRITVERAIKLREARRLSQARQEQVRLEREKARLRIQ